MDLVNRVQTLAKVINCIHLNAFRKSMNPPFLTGQIKSSILLLADDTM